MTKVITINELKIGDRIADSEPTKFGQFINKSVESIRVTKGGRYVMFYTYFYKDSAGIVSGPHRLNYSNGAVVATSPITIVTD